MKPDDFNALEALSSEIYFQTFDFLTLWMKL